jgi:hypothetical protein
MDSKKCHSSLSCPVDSQLFRIICDLHPTHYVFIDVHFRNVFLFDSGGGEKFETESFTIDFLVCHVNSLEPIAAYLRHTKEADLVAQMSDILFDDYIAVTSLERMGLYTPILKTHLSLMDSDESEVPF